MQIVHEGLEVVVAYVVAVTDLVFIDQGVAAVEQEGRRRDGVVLIRVHRLAVDLDVEDTVATLCIRIVGVRHVVGQAHVQARAAGLLRGFLGPPLVLQGFLNRGTGEGRNGDVVTERLDCCRLLVGHVALCKIIADTASVHDAEIDFGVKKG